MSSRSLLACLALLLPAAALAEPEAPAPLQPDAREALAPDRTVDILQLALDLEVDVVGRRISGTATHTLRPLRTGLKRIRLHAVALDIEAVTIDGAPAPFTVAPQHLSITLPGPSDPAATHTLAITYSAEPQLGLHWRAPGPDSPDTYPEVWSQGEDRDNRYWFPTWDEPDDRFTYTGSFTVADRFTAVSNGRLLRKESAKPGWTRWTYALSEQDLVSYLVMFAAAEYQLLQDRWRDKPVLAYIPPDADPARARAAVAPTPAMLDFMSEVTGAEYPYPGYTQVFVQRFIYTGMENTSATVMERRLLHPERLAPHSSWTESVVAHELAHQWFGDQLTTRDWSHMWLNEGITTFLEGWWWEHAHGPELGADKVFGRVLRTLRAEQKNPRPLVVDFFAREGERRSSNVYAKGSVLMSGLRSLLGEADFRRAFQAYVATHQHGMVTTDDLQRSFEETTGLDLDWYFQQWVWLAGHPVLTVSHAWDAEESTLRVDLAQTQEVGGLVPRFTLPVDLLVGAAGGIQRHRVWLEDDTASLVLPLTTEPAWVAVDPDGSLLADVQQTQSDASWAALITSDADAGALRRAWHALAQREEPPGEPLRIAVEGTLANPQAHPLWRRLAVAALGAWKDATSRTTLVAALGPLGGGDGPGVPGIADSPRLQEAIADALAESPEDPAVAAALTALHGRGPNEVVTGSALVALSKVDEDAGLARARAVLKGAGGHDDRRWRYALDVLGRLGESRDLDRIDRLRDPSVDHATRSAALRASAKIANREPVGAARDRAREAVADDAEAGLADLNLRGVQGAAGVLGSVGDLGSVAVLQAARSASTVPAVRDAMTRAIERIRTRKEVDPKDAEDGGALTAQVKKLEERIDALGERLEALQDQR